MKNRRNLILLILLLIVLLIVAYTNFTSGQTFLGPTDDGKFARMPIEETRLSLEKLKEISLLEYQGTGRNIFVYGPPPPPPQPQPGDPGYQPPPPPPPPINTGPAPLNVPFRFYGYVTEQLTGRRRAFFTNGDDVFITAEGGTLQNRFRLVRINPTSAIVEEIATGRTATLALEEITG